MFVFNKSVKGYSHIQRGSVCEDASASFASPDGRYYICAVADGHGDKRCFRSSFGSSAAVRAAVDKLKSFAELVLSEGNSKDGMLFKLINDPRYQRDSIKQLTDCILSEWSSAVTKDYNSDPPTAEELALLDNSSLIFNKAVTILSDETDWSEEITADTISMLVAALHSETYVLQPASQETLREKYQAPHSPDLQIDGYEYDDEDYSRTWALEFRRDKDGYDIVNIALHISLKNFEQQCNGINIHVA